MDNELPTLKKALRGFKRQFIIDHLLQTQGSRTLAAKNMNIQRTYLSRLISIHGIKDKKQVIWTCENHNIEGVK